MQSAECPLNLQKCCWWGKKLQQWNPELGRSNYTLSDLWNILIYINCFHRSSVVSRKLTCSLPVSLSLTHSLSLPVCVSSSPCVSLSLSVSLAVCLSLSLSVSLSDKTLTIVVLKKEHYESDLEREACQMQENKGKKVDKKWFRDLCKKRNPSFLADFCILKKSVF